MIDTSKYADNGFQITNSEFIELQKNYKIDVTIFTEADHHIHLFGSQVLNRRKKLQGRTVGFFLRPFYYYQKASFLNRLRYIKNFNLKSDNLFFYEFLVKRFRLLNSALTIDENYVSHNTYFKWVPDMFQQYAENILKEEKTSQRAWIKKINDFKNRNKDRFCFLYFGTTQFRRGYDLLLKMAVENDACFIHCGLSTEDDKYLYNTNDLRSILQMEGRLMETNEYISDPLSIEHFFKATDHLILPYRDFFGSSGVMLQALSYGIPVLVPESGVMGYRVKKYQLGMTYNTNTDSLNEKFNDFIKMPKSMFEDSILKYMKFQNPYLLKAALVNILGNGIGEPVKHP